MQCLYQVKGHVTKNLTAANKANIEIKVALKDEGKHRSFLQDKLSNALPTTEAAIDFLESLMMMSAAQWVKKDLAEVNGVASINSCVHTIFVPTVRFYGTIIDATWGKGGCLIRLR